MWAELPENCRLKRDDPATHIGPFADDDVQDDALHMRKDFRWQIRQFGTEQWQELGMGFDSDASAEAHA